MIIIIESKKILQNIEIKNIHKDHVYGQDEFSLRAYFNKDIIGYLDYSVYEDIPTIKYLEVKNEFRRMGIGTHLLKELQRLYPNTEIQQGMTTDDGTQFVKSLNTQFVPNDQYNDLMEKKRRLEIQLNTIEKEFEENNYTNGDKYNDFTDELTDIKDKLYYMKKGKYIIQ